MERTDAMDIKVDIEAAPLTLDEYLALGEDVKAEIIEGELVAMSPTGPYHGEINVNIIRFLLPYVLKHRAGKLYTEQTAFVEPGAEGLKGALVPDVAFVCRAKLDPARDPNRPFDFPPDLAVEVLSPSDTYQQITAKIKTYLERGASLASLVWIVNPFDETVTVYTPADPPGKIHAPGDALDGSDVLPGFRLPVADIFADILAGTES
ncbi:MAG: Uma2 family endonuclease [Anaerolineae bacterium]|nr:Uma2 family endonuclease [Anaerolineae bacterium]